MRLMSAAVDGFTGVWIRRWMGKADCSAVILHGYWLTARQDPGG